MRALPLLLACCPLAAQAPEHLPGGLELVVKPEPDHATFTLALMIPLRSPLLPGELEAWLRRGAPPPLLSSGWIEGDRVMLTVAGHTDHVEEAFAFLGRQILNPRLPGLDVLDRERDHLHLGEAGRILAREQAEARLEGRPSRFREGRTALPGDLRLRIALDPQGARLVAGGDVLGSQVRRLAWQYLGLWVRPNLPLEGPEGPSRAGADLAVPGAEWEIVAGLPLPRGGAGRVLARLLEEGLEELPRGGGWRATFQGATGRWVLTGRGMGPGMPDPGLLRTWLARVLEHGEKAGRLASLRNQVLAEADRLDLAVQRWARGEAPVPEAEVLLGALRTLRPVDLKVYRLLPQDRIPSGSGP